MALSIRITASLLAAQGAIALVSGATVLVVAVLDERAPIGRTGDVVGPPEGAVQWLLTSLLVVLGVAICMLGAIDLLAWGAFVRRGTRAWMVAACPITALAWFLLAGWAFLRAAGSGDHLMAWCAAALVATTIALTHLAALRTCFSPPAAQR